MPYRIKIFNVVSGISRGDIRLYPFEKSPKFVKLYGLGPY